MLLLELSVFGGGFQRCIETACDGFDHPHGIMGISLDKAGVSSGTHPFYSSLYQDQTFFHCGDQGLCGPHRVCPVRCLSSYVLSMSVPTFSVTGPCILSLSGMAKFGGGTQFSKSAQHSKARTELNSGLSLGVLAALWDWRHLLSWLFYFSEPQFLYLSNGSNGGLC